MIVGIIVGGSLGFWGGITVGNFLFRGGQPKEFSQLDESADEDPLVPHPAGGKVGSEMRSVLPYAPHWCKWPDFERVTWVNSIIHVLWPYYDEAIRKMVMESVGPTLKDLANKYSFIESIDIERLELGSRPITLGGLKTYETREDEVILEAPIQWGSDMVVRASAKIKTGLVVLYIPIEIRDMLLSATARITIRPLVDTLPCLGAVSVSLLELPYIDLTVDVIGGIDLMSVPGVRLAMQMGIKAALEDMMVYPNHMAFPLMENGGLPPKPAGMLVVRLARIKGLKVGGDLLSKVDPYVELEIREGRDQRSVTVMNNADPEYDQEFNMLVDDLETQSLKIRIRDEDNLWYDKLLATAQISLDPEVCEATRVPRRPQHLVIPLLRPDSASLMKNVKSIGMSTLRLLSVRKSKAKKGALPRDTHKPHHNKNLDIGTLYMDIVFIPFTKDEEDDEEDEEEGEEGAKKKKDYTVRSKVERIVTAKVRDDMKGVLTVFVNRCRDLQSEGSRMANARVVVRVSDSLADKDEERETPIVLNEENPRFGTKFEFVYINAGSYITFEVYDRPGAMENMLNVRAWTGRNVDRMIGKLRMPVKDVVKTQSIKDVFALQETKQGQIDLRMEWEPVLVKD